MINFRTLLINISNRRPYWTLFSNALSINCIPLYYYSFSSFLDFIRIFFNETTLIPCTKFTEEYTNTQVVLSDKYYVWPPPYFPANEIGNLLLELSNLRLKMETKKSILRLIRSQNDPLGKHTVSPIRHLVPTT